MATIHPKILAKIHPKIHPKMMATHCVHQHNYRRPRTPPQNHLLPQTAVALRAVAGAAIATSMAASPLPTPP